MIWTMLLIGCCAEIINVYFVERASEAKIQVLTDGNSNVVVMDQGIGQTMREVGNGTLPFQSQSIHIGTSTAR